MQIIGVFKLQENAVAWNESVITQPALAIRPIKSSTFGMSSALPHRKP